MDRDQIEQHWDLVSKQVMRTWGKLDEDDLAEIAGNHSRFVALMQSRYAYGEVEAANRVDRFIGQIKRPLNNAESTG